MGEMAAQELAKGTETPVSSESTSQCILCKNAGSDSEMKSLQEALVMQGHPDGLTLVHVLGSQILSFPPVREKYCLSCLRACERVSKIKRKIEDFRSRETLIGHSLSKNNKRKASSQITSTENSMKRSRLGKESAKSQTGLPEIESLADVKIESEYEIVTQDNFEGHTGSPRSDEIRYEVQINPDFLIKEEPENESQAELPKGFSTETCIADVKKEPGLEVLTHMNAESDSRRLFEVEVKDKSECQSQVTWANMPLTESIQRSSSDEGRGQSINLTESQISGVNFTSKVPSLQFTPTSFCEAQGKSVLENQIQSQTSVNTVPFFTLKASNSFTSKGNTVPVSQISGVNSVNRMPSVRLVGSNIVPGNQMSGVNPVNGMLSVKLIGTQYVPGSQISGANSVSGMPSVWFIGTQSVPGSQISGANSVSGIPSVRLIGTQSVPGSQISGVNSVSGMPSVRLIGTQSVPGSQISEVNSVSGMPSVRLIGTQSVPGSQISEVNSVSGIPSVRLIGTQSVPGSQISEVNSVSGIPSVRLIGTQSVPGSQISGVNSVSGIPSVRLIGTQSVPGSQISEVNFVSGIPSVRLIGTQSVPGSQISEVNSVSGIPSVRLIGTPSVPGSQISGVNSVIGMPSVRLIGTQSVPGSQISEVNSVSGMPSVRLIGTQSVPGSQISGENLISRRPLLQIIPTSSCIAENKTMLGNQMSIGQLIQPTSTLPENQMQGAASTVNSVSNQLLFRLTPTSSVKGNEKTLPLNQTQQEISLANLAGNVQLSGNTARSFVDDQNKLPENKKQNQISVESLFPKMSFTLPKQSSHEGNTVPTNQIQMQVLGVNCSSQRQILQPEPSCISLSLKQVQHPPSGVNASSQKQDQQLPSDDNASSQKQVQQPLSGVNASSQKQVKQLPSDDNASSQKQVQQPLSCANSSSQKQVQQPPYGDNASSHKQVQHSPSCANSSCQKQVQQTPSCANSLSQKQAQQPPYGDNASSQKQVQHSPSCANSSCQKQVQQTPSCANSLSQKQAQQPPYGDNASSQKQVQQSPSCANSLSQKQAQQPLYGDNASSQKQVQQSPSCANSSSQKQVQQSPSCANSSSQKQVQQSPSCANSLSQKQVLQPPSGVNASSHKQVQHISSGFNSVKMGLQCKDSLNNVTTVEVKTSHLQGQCSRENCEFVSNDNPNISFSPGNLLQDTNKCFSTSDQDTYEEFVHRLSHCKTFDDIVNVILMKKLVRNYIEKKILIDIDRACKRICSRDHVLGRLLKIDLASSGKMDINVFDKVLQEMQKALPFITRVLKVICFNPTRKPSAKFTLVMMFAMGMHLRSPDMSYLQQLNTCLIDEYGSAELLNLLSKLSFTLDNEAKEMLVQRMKRFKPGLLANIAEGSEIVDSGDVSANGKNSQTAKELTACLFEDVLPLCSITSDENDKDLIFFMNAVNSCLNFKGIAKLAFDTKEIRNCIEYVLLREIDGSCDTICARSYPGKISMFRDDLAAQGKIETDLFETIRQEVMESNPFLYKVLEVMCSVKPSTSCTVAMIFAMGIQTRCIHMSYLQQLNTILVSQDGSLELLNVLNKLHFTLNGFGQQSLMLRKKQLKAHVLADGDGGEKKLCKVKISLLPTTSDRNTNKCNTEKKTDSVQTTHNTDENMEELSTETQTKTNAFGKKSSESTKDDSKEIVDTNSDANSDTLQLDGDVEISSVTADLSRQTDSEKNENLSKSHSLNPVVSIKPEERRGDNFLNTREGSIKKKRRAVKDISAIKPYYFHAKIMAQAEFEAIMREYKAMLMSIPGPDYKTKHTKSEGSSHGSTHRGKTCRSLVLIVEQYEKLLSSIENENKNTKKKTDSDMRLFMSFLTAKNETRSPEFIPPDQLNTLLCEFILGVTKKDGTEYEPITLTGFFGSIDRHLKANGSKSAIFKDTEFYEARAVLRKKQQELKRQGLGNKPKTAEPLDDTIIARMHEVGTLGGSNPRALINSLWLICTTHFGMRTSKEFHDLCWGDIQLGLDETTGEEFIVYDKEWQTKTRSGSNPRKTRMVKPKAFSTDNMDRDPVHLYKLYREKRPEEMNQPDSPFFLTPAGPPYKCWFKKLSMGINKLYSIMADMKNYAGIQNARIPPYFSRVRLVQKLQDEGEPPNQIVQTKCTKSEGSSHDSTDRWKTCIVEQNEKLLSSIENENKNTKKKTDSDMRLFMSFLMAKNETRSPEFIPPDQLNTLLCEFILGVTKKDGTEYEPTTLTGIVGSIDRHLKANGSKSAIFRNTEFHKARAILSKKQQELKRQGLGNKPKTAEPLDDTIIARMHEVGTLGGSNPRALIHSLWLICTTHFGMRTSKEFHDLCWGDIQLGIDETTGDEFIVYDKEQQTKTRSGSNPRDTRMVKPKAFSTDDMDRDPVHLYKLYREKRPEEMNQPDSPFFLSPSGPPYKCWFKKLPLGINKLYSIMADMKNDAGIQNARIPPYCSRVRLVQKLQDEGEPPNQIVQTKCTKSEGSSHDSTVRGKTCIVEQNEELLSSIDAKMNMDISCKHSNIDVPSNKPQEEDGEQVEQPPPARISVQSTSEPTRIPHTCKHCPYRTYHAANLWRHTEAVHKARYQ